MSLPKEIQKIYLRIDKVAKGGKENFLQYYSLIDEYIKKGNWDGFKQCLYLSYGLSVDDLSSDSVKKETWAKILFKTNTTLQDQKYSLFKRNGIYNQGIGYYLEGTNPTRKLCDVKEVIELVNPNNYQNHRNTNILSPKRTHLEVTINQVLPESFLDTSISDFITSVTQSEYLEDSSKERIQSGLTSFDIDRKYVYQIISNPESSYSMIISGNKYQSLIDQKLEIDFRFDVYPQTGTGSFFVSIFNYSKSTSKFIDFYVGTHSYSEYNYTGGSTFSVHGNKIIDVNANESVGLSVYKRSDLDISFNFSSVQIDMISHYLKDAPIFLLSDDINWIKNNNSFRISQSGVSSATVSQRLQSKIVFSDWDDSKSYDKNMINLYNQVIDYIV